MLSSGLSTTLHSEQRMDHLVELAANEKEQMEIGEPLTHVKNRQSGLAAPIPARTWSGPNASQPRMG
jgi:hypothetical protein